MGRAGEREALPVLYGASPLVGRVLEAAAGRADARPALRSLVEAAVSYGWEGDLWHAALAESLAKSVNPFSLAAERRDVAEDSLWRLALDDMDRYLRWFDLRLPAALAIARTFAHDPSGAPRAEAGRRLARLARSLAEAASAGDAEAMLRQVAAFHHDYGTGELGLGELFRVAAGEGGFAPELVAVEGLRPVALDDLVGYERQKRLLRENTEAFLAGHRANNVLLYGDAGTGKSTSVQALATEYAFQGLRVIELTKRQFALIPALLDAIKRRNYRFALLLDDLSFEEDEVEYKTLKQVMEGGGEAAPENVLFYATSNRRHLVKETWADRSDLEHDGDVHRSDTMEEKLSLAGRFGLQIYYPNPTFEEYHAIVRALVGRSELAEGVSEEELRAQAATWQVRRGNRSGRTARQFVSDFLSRRSEPGATGDSPR